MSGGPGGQNLGQQHSGAMGSQHGQAIAGHPMGGPGVMDGKMHAPVHHGPPAYMPPQHQGMGARQMPQAMHSGSMSQTWKDESMNQSRMTGQMGGMSGGMGGPSMMSNPNPNMQADMNRMNAMPSNPHQMAMSNQSSMHMG